MEGSIRAALTDKTLVFWIVGRLQEVGEHGCSTEDSSGHKFPGFTMFISSIIISIIFCAKWAAKQNKYCTKHFLLRIDLHNFCISFISRFYTPKRNARQSWILHSMLWIPDSRYWITVFLRLVRGTPDSLSCIPDSKGFPGFYISPLELPRFLDA